MMMMVTMMKLITISVVVLRFYKCVVEEALLGKDPDGAEDFSAGICRRRSHHYHHEIHMLKIFVHRSIFNGANPEGTTKV